ncbi:MULTISPECIES: amidase [Salipiger]|jgi:amidase|uniref:Amidase n=1 Tax=Salipiger profundus TaxID=1229727 RepID=A0A1U7D892_9RHOB|nr:MULTISPECIES: amidase [Salipiger]APX24397.1 amidase [Salipiger profundus]GGA19667.1 amidase [Salipiger profundus]SFD37543.1 amidase [Salipiger profundus]
MSGTEIADPTQLGATQIVEAMRDGKLSSRALMEAVLDRIDRLNPGINAIVSLRPRAELLAEARDRDNRALAGPLHGLPVAIKDLVATKGLRTTFGSPVFADNIPEADDLVAARLKAAGAIVIGKTNTPEWGHGSHTFNPVFGPTRNPYDPACSAGGSSGGAAAALAARMLPLADGSDMMGSLRNPAAFCNVYGFRPSWGLVPQDSGGDTFLSTLSTEGPMARSPRDLALLLSVLAGPNPEAPFGRPPPDLSDIGCETLSGKRIGWLADWGGAYPLEPGIRETCEAALAVFEDLGAIVEPLDPPFPAEDLWSSWTTLRAGLNAGSKQALASDPEKRALTKPESLWEIDQGQALSAAAFYEASRIRSLWYREAAQLFERFDALALPSAQVWPFPVDWRHPTRIGSREMDTYHRWMEVVVPVSLAGLPCLGLPAGFSDAGLPMGMQLFGPTGSDAAILAMGDAYHRATDWPPRRPPALS